MNRLELSLPEDIHEIVLEQYEWHRCSITLNKRRYEIDWQDDEALSAARGL
jgi:hypothetical protein